ncbi:MAG: type II toxin-antitoxin system prevent-host-death family antitoxin [Firmicutes bacterium]|nr:type II toxin-antitoxin system prevent-host-death family antitoxin [Bacillota bacterium]
MIITATELKENLSMYLEKSEEEDIYITKNGRVVSMLCNAYKDKIEKLNSLIGILPEDADFEEIRKGRLTEYENLD